MDRPIERRDFLQGAAIGIGAAALGLRPPNAAGATGIAPQPVSPDDPAYYPPTRVGLRGSHPGSFEAAHALRDGRAWPTPADTGESYDLVVVGGGISGLSAAWFWLKARPDARILILENHDDFGGHAKRNEFDLGGRTMVVNGGTLEIDSPRPYSAVASGVLTALGVDPVALASSADRSSIFKDLGLGKGVFFDKETFGRDHLMVLPQTQPPGSARGRPDPAALARALSMAPLSEAARRDIVRIETGAEDPLADLSMQQKRDRLSRLSYRDYLLTVVKADSGAIPYFQTLTHGEWGVGIDAEPALDCWGIGLPGFEGLNLTLDEGGSPRMGYTALGYRATGGSDRYHFPDGNASIARLLVRRLIPASAPGRTAQDIVTARFDYAALDRPASPVRLRLNSIVVNARNAPDHAGVEVVYRCGGRAYAVRGGACVMAGYNMMIPYIVPDLPEPQKAALHQLVKVPLVYTSVAVTNWRAFERLKVSSVAAPGAYFSSFRLEEPQAIGGYATAATPDQPTVIQLVRTPCAPGSPTERDQHRAGRAELLATPFETFERHIRDQLGRTLGPGGFDPATDITAIVVNRWPHGYAYEYNPLYDPWDVADAQRPHRVGRQRFGRIAIANSDSGAAAYTSSAIDQAHRAVTELIEL